MLHVFVSSTWLDLQPERKVVEDTLHRIRETRFVGMEYFGSREDTTREVSLAEVDHSDFYLGIFGERYGSGITEDEYRRAQARGLPAQIYFKEEATVQPEHREQDPAKAAHLTALKEELRRAHTIQEFSSLDALATLVSTDLHRWIVDKYLTPQLEQAIRGKIPRHETQALIRDIKDWSGFSPGLLTQLQTAGFAVASGSRSVAVGGNVSDSIITTGDANVITRTTYGSASAVTSPSQLLAGLAPLLEQLRAALNTADWDPKVARIASGDLDTVTSEAQDAHPNKAIIEAKLRSVEAMARRAAGNGASGTIALIQSALSLIQRLPE
jgi:hypothetical protein